MRHHKVINYYNKAFLKGAYNSETLWTCGMKSSKKIIKNKKLIFKLKKLAMRFAGRLIWPNMFPTALDPISGTLLYDLIRLTKPDVAVEIGTFKGYSAICLAQGLEDNQRGILYTIDPVEQPIVYQAIKKAGLGHCIKYVIDYSQNAIPKLELDKIDFVFIDGDHDYENCRRDFNLIKDLFRKSVLFFCQSPLSLRGQKGVVVQVRVFKFLPPPFCAPENAKVS